MNYAALALSLPFIMAAGLILYVSFQPKGRDYNGEYGSDL